jgi:hypothetical protein
MKAPSSKLQAPEKFQAPGSKRSFCENWCLEFDVSLVLAAWNLELLLLS